MCLSGLGKLNPSFQVLPPLPHRRWNQGRPLREERLGAWIRPVHHSGRCRMTDSSSSKQKEISKVVRQAGWLQDKVPLCFKIGTLLWRASEKVFLYQLGWPAETLAGRVSCDSARMHARRLPFTAPPGSPHPRVPAPPVHCTPGPLHPWSTALPGPRLPAARAEGMRGPSYRRLQRQRGWAPRWTPSASETDVHPTGITPGLNVVQPLPESRPAAATLK